MEVLKKSGPSSLNNVIVHDKQIPTQGPVNLTNSYRVMDIDVVGTKPWTSASKHRSVP